MAREDRGWVTIRQGFSAERDSGEGQGLVPVRVGASVFHPPMGAVAAALAPLDPLVGRVTTFGAAFLLLEAEKPGRRAGS